VDSKLGNLRIIKGAFAEVSPLAAPSSTASAAASELESKGYRVLAVAAGPPATMQLLGLIALSDPARSDSAALVTELKSLGIRTVMVTGDAPATASVVAHAVGLDGAVCPPGPIPADVRPETFSVYAGVLPEDKYKLVKAFQKAGNNVGMCGDGANDAPALRQAQMGIAVSTATDVAKSAAGVVLTDPGLVGIVAAVKEGRITFQRIFNYTLRSVTAKIATVQFLVVGLLITGHAILTPMLMVVLMLAGDFLGMSSTTDNVRPSAHPNRWRIGSLTLGGVFLGVCELSFCVSVLLIGYFRIKMGLATLQTLAFATLVCGNQAATYNVRTRRRICSAPLPSRWLVLSSVADLLIAFTLAWRGWLMMPLSPLILISVLGGAIAFTFLLNLVKVPVFSRLKIA
jgi:H+-transporting ATPase